jgi:hypothetical protein
LGGLLVGAIVKLVGLDAFTLLVGRSPGDITGAPEGLVLGATIGLAYSLKGSLRRSVTIAALATAVAGAVIPLLGGRLLIGSLEQLARQFPDSRLRLEPLGTLFGEHGVGPFTEAALGALEGALFGGCVVAAMVAVQRGFLRPYQARVAAM